MYLERKKERKKEGKKIIKVIVNFKQIPKLPEIIDILKLSHFTV